MDKQLTCEIAKLAAVDDKVVARHEEKCDQLMHQLAKVFWRGSYERALPVDPNKIFDTDMLVEFAQRVIERKGEEGNCVGSFEAPPRVVRSSGEGEAHFRIPFFRLFRSAAIILTLLSAGFLI